ncbi:hypothetical protein [Clostridium drakei]|uniref:Uncharacterized protein n=1 Tax=Clostridium drakei TaxID=332101 RepID=A0A2U8DTZ8_9CLOT|nr:hypothetical protein [Clostridium drakei]AWI06266.1 hypothetical protein B9W14_17730 [Clostridium drakei]
MTNKFKACFALAKQALKINESYLVGIIPLSLDELSRGVATVSFQFNKSGSVTLDSHQIN